ncbi:Uncharacterized protein SCF082_LOCUS22748, partial [Durusdinium trenchii]
MGRVISALRTLGRAAPDGASEAVTRKAEMIEVYAEFGELDRPKAVRYLRDKFMALSVDEAMEPQEKEGTIIALGGKPSKSDLKVFSTPSAESKGSGPDARGPSGRGVMITMKSAEGGLGQAAGSPARSDAGSESRLRAKLARVSASRQASRSGGGIGSAAPSKADSEVGGEKSLAAALEEQTRVLKEALSSRGSSSEEFEDVCALANSCKGMSAREKLLALRARCKGSRLTRRTRTCTVRPGNREKRWKTQKAVYERIKSKHLLFSEPREEREIQVDSVHVALVKGRLTGHQLEPLFEASVAELEEGDPRKEKSCWDFRDHGSCRKGRDCPFSHDKELRRRELEKKGAGKYPANGDGKGKQDERGGGKGNAKKGGDDKGKPKEGKQRPFFAKKGFCKKGAACDMVHLLTATTTAAGE